MEANKVPFTFYGDLLGVSDLYRVDASLAFRKLGQFYDLIYDEFSQMAREREIEIFLFSDLIIITGDKLRKTIQKLTRIYNKLIDKHILLKGAVVSGRLIYDKRLQLKTLQKRLPLNDSLFRAAMLEKNADGMRLILESRLTRKILPKEWWTDDLYEENAGIKNYKRDDFRRKIVLMSEVGAYEFLWPYTCGLRKFTPSELEGFEIKKFKHPYQKIKERLPQVPKHARKHLRETMFLFKRAEYRCRITSETLGSI